MQPGDIVAASVILDKRPLAVAGAFTTASMIAVPFSTNWFSAKENFQGTRHCRSCRV
jgi:hypothetical protein